MNNLPLPTGAFTPVACCAMTRGGTCHMIRPLAAQAEVQAFCEEMGQLFILLSADGVTNTKLALSQYQKGLPVYLLGNLPERVTSQQAPCAGDISEAVMWANGWNACLSKLQASATLLPALPDPLNDDRIGTTTNGAFAKGWNALRETLRDTAVALPPLTAPATDRRGFNTGDNDLDALLDTVYALGAGLGNMDVAIMMLDQITAVRERLCPADPPAAEV